MFKFEHQSVVSKEEFEENETVIKYLDGTYGLAPSREAIAEYFCCKIEEIEDFTSVEEV
ncbi:hypothetical protein PP940_gp059 [Rhizobium phage RL2RES]|uniref:Uncharacterized protein n=1 Tax=Rhizobium phage RL2RES TaxID=103371 RepID=A0A6B9J400_9CAUD|nr:hypothetical protein PP940_gp059 [Rhizobium phage RL2RES]QGZ14352.1 hypothetical protein RL2RES_059 [Rhizobium phage RL2RES]